MSVRWLKLLSRSHGVFRILTAPHIYANCGFDSCRSFKPFLLALLPANFWPCLLLQEQERYELMQEMTRVPADEVFKEASTELALSYGLKVGGLSLIPTSSATIAAHSPLFLARGRQRSGPPLQLNGSRSTEDVYFLQSLGRCA